MSSRGPRFRRNGKLQACEPCRKQKIRCDHALPACGRCKRRNTESECMYHPAPLTRSEGAPVNSPSNWRNASSSLATGSTNQSTVSPNEDVTVTAASTAIVSGVESDTVTGFLGSTSFSEVFKASRHISDNVWLEPLANVKKLLRTPPTYKLSADRINAGAKILGLLTDSAYVKSIIEQYYHVSQIVIAPWTTLKHSVDSIINLLREDYPTDGERRRLAEKIFAQTFVPLRVDENTTAENFHESFTGPKLRWEILGVVYTYLALGSLVADSEPRPASLERQQFTLELTHASNLCVSFCDRAESLNDVLVWLLHGNAILLTFQYGDASHLAWRRIGDLASTIFAMGFHQDPSINQPKLPFFLAELRRRCFANSFSSDKALSTFFGRPPRIAMRYSSCRMPYDLTDEELIAPPEIRNNAIARLDSAGWNTNGAVHRQTWARVKLLLNVIREDVLELSLGPPAPDADQRQKAQSTLDRARITWNSIPDFARYDDTCWDSGLASSSCFSLLYYFLHITYSEFLLYRILARHGGSSWDAVYEVALKLLSGVLNISRHRDRIGGLSRDFSWVAIFYGLPSAALLAIELLRQQQQSDASHVVLPRAEIIRNISVFISSLEWVAKPDDGNYDLCQGAHHMLERILDAILEDRPVASTPVSQTAPADPVMWVDELFGGGWMASGPFVDSLGTENAPAWELPGNWPFEF